MKRFRCTLLLFFISATAFSQLDTNYVVSYKHRLAVSLYQSYRYFQLYTTQSMIPDANSISNIDYIARGNNSTGFSIDYDKISFSLGWKTPVEEIDTARKGITSTKNLALSFNARKTRIETSLRKYTGFFDNHTMKYGPEFADSVPYFQNSKMSNQVIRVKAIHFFNKKNRFSYGAAYANTQRQLKSAGTFILVGNIYHLQMNSDLPFITPHIPDTFYGSWNDWNKLDVTGFSVCPGYSFNLVIFKRFFGNLTIDWGPELQRRTYGSTDGDPAYKDWKLSMSSADVRFSLGYNGKYFYMYSFFTGDYSVFKNDDLRLDNRLIGGGFTFGYRFKFENKFTEWLKNNKIYKWI
jgi:hypothetical protein